VISNGRVIKFMAKFDQRELELLEKIKRQEERWRCWRWLVLALGAVSILNTIIWAYLLFVPLLPLNADRLTTAAFAATVVSGFFWPSLFFVMWCLGVVIRDWHGNVKNTLLLQLAEQMDVG